MALSPRPDHIAATLLLSDLRDLTPAIGRCRRLLDLDADPVAIDEALAADPALRPLIESASGRRASRAPPTPTSSPCAPCSASRSRGLHPPARLVQRFGTPIADPVGGLTHLFPTPDALTDIDADALPG